MLIIILSILAVYRISYLLVHEDGPFRVIANTRDYLLDNFGLEQPRNYKYPHRIFITTMQTISDAFECTYCTGIWVAFVVIALNFNDLTIITIIFGVAGGQHIIERYFQHNENKL